MTTDIELIDERATEIVARALDMLGVRMAKSGYAGAKSAGVSARFVADDLRKPPATRKVIAFTQITDGPELPKEGQWIEDSEGSFEQVPHDFTNLKCLIFTRTESTEYGKLH